MNEIIITNTNNIPEFTNKALRKATEQILKIGDTVRKCAFATARVIYEVNESKCYEEDGFANVHEWTEKTFGFKKSASYSLLKVGTEYVNEIRNNSGKVIGYKSNLVPEEETEDFTTWQIIKMLPLGHEVAVEMVEDGEITPDMAVREIEKIVKEKTKPEAESTETEGESEVASEEEANESANRETVIVAIIDEDGNPSKERYEIPVELLKLYRIKK